jgi:hypothetical protein
MPACIEDLELGDAAVGWPAVGRSLVTKGRSTVKVKPGGVRRALVRIISDDNLDLYILATAALAFTVLGTVGISDVKMLSSVLLALLAYLALSQVRSRRQVALLRQEWRGGPAALFRRGFPFRPNGSAGSRSLVAADRVDHDQDGAGYPY